MFVGPPPLVYSPLGAPRNLTVPTALSYVVRGPAIAERTAAIRRARGPWDRFIDAMAGVWR